MDQTTSVLEGQHEKENQPDRVGFLFLSGFGECFFESHRLRREGSRSARKAVGIAWGESIASYNVGVIDLPFFNITLKNKHFCAIIIPSKLYGGGK